MKACRRTVRRVRASRRVPAVRVAQFRRLIASRLLPAALVTLSLMTLTGAGRPFPAVQPVLAVSPAPAVPSSTPDPPPPPSATPDPAPAETPAPTAAPVTVVLWSVGIDQSALRTGPSKKEAPVRLLRQGELVQLLSDDKPGWLYVMTAEGRKGYLDANQAAYHGTQAFTLTQAPPEGWRTLPRYVVRSCWDAALRYRDRMELRDNVIDRIGPGETVHVVKMTGIYFQVVRASTGQTGYMLSGALDPVDPPAGWETAGGVVGYDPTVYTYEEMLEDIGLLLARYPDWLDLACCGYSVLGREIPVLRLGGASTELSILAHASIHAREYHTSALLMEQIETLLAGLEAPGADGDALRALFGQVAVYAVPMVNPDGVSLSQWGLSSVPESRWLDQLCQWQARDCPVYGTRWYDNYFPTWKANIAGVDLNRNFDARWRYCQSARDYGPLNYKGAAPHSEPETLFMVRLLEEIPLSAHLSYHSPGNSIFWYFRQTGGLYQRNYSLAAAVKTATGYWLAPMKNSLESNAGFKDYAVEKFGIPGVTIEIGMGDNPLPFTAYLGVWERNKDLLAVTAQWALDDARQREAQASPAP